MELDATMTQLLCHYYDESTGPCVNLSDLELKEAERILNTIRAQKKGFASQRSGNYLQTRFLLETKVRDMFIAKGGKPIRDRPHYMTYDRVPWLLTWYPNGREIPIPISAFKPDTISFTYGDLFPTMRFADNKPYRGQVYTIDEIEELVRLYGFPQEWNPEGVHGPERYIEVQVWDDTPLRGAGFR